MEEVINSNTCGYIKIDKMFIDDIEQLHGEYLRIKDILIKEIIKECEIHKESIDHNLK